MKMADFGRGIKAGVAVAAIYLVISVILAVIGYKFWYLSDFIYAAGLGISLWLMDPSFVITLILTNIVPYIIRGIIFGAVFAALYNFLPGTKSVIKGVVLSSFLWIVAVIEVIYITTGWAWHANGFGFSGSGTYYSGMISLSSVGLALAGIISALVFGALTGLLWDRFRPKRLAEARKGSPVLLITFILGGVMWALLAIGFVIGVVIEGAPAISPEFWWDDILATSVVFLGLPGWVLTLVGWRKTKGDESGLKWGVAGGVMMALTGFMLLPGALAIAGGVFSGRKPSTESGTAEIEQQR
jgi:hypothetical protein